MNINIKSSAYCKMLVDRIHRTLADTGYDMGRITKQPLPFCQNDVCIFEGLSMAILSIQANWDSIEKNLPAIKKHLFNYNIGTVASLTDKQIDVLYRTRFQPLRIQSRRLKQRLTDIRDDAIIFQIIKQKHGSVRDFIMGYLARNQVNNLRCQFIGTCDGFKLHGVGPPICSEFFKAIGIDEFKADVHTTRFLITIGLAKKTAPSVQIRRIGIGIAKNSGNHRIYIDSLIWHFCGEDRGAICTRNNPRCRLCRLKIEEPVLCNYVVHDPEPKRISKQKGEEMNKANKKSAWETTDEVKWELAYKYLSKDSARDEKCLFLQAPDFHEWAPYIGGFVLTNKKGMAEFRPKDIENILQDEIIPKDYHKPGFKESMVLPHDVRVDAPDENPHGFPSLERIDEKNHMYKFIGLREGIRERYGIGILKEMLSNCGLKL